MHASASKFFSEFRQMIDMFWWSFIKAPAALIAAWAFLSMLSNPANVAAQTMRIAHAGGLTAELMTGVVTVWFISACAAFGVALFARLVFRTRLFQAEETTVRSENGACFHP